MGNFGMVNTGYEKKKKQVFFMLKMLIFTQNTKTGDFDKNVNFFEKKHIFQNLPLK